MARKRINSKEVCGEMHYDLICDIILGVEFLVNVVLNMKQVFECMNSL